MILFPLRCYTYWRSSLLKLRFSKETRCRGCFEDCHHLPQPPPYRGCSRIKHKEDIVRQPTKKYPIINTQNFSPSLLLPVRPWWKSSPADTWSGTGKDYSVNLSGQRMSGSQQSGNFKIWNPPTTILPANPAMSQTGSQGFLSFQTKERGHP